jgi:hypothetical protein
MQLRTLARTIQALEGYELASARTHPCDHINEIRVRLMLPVAVAERFVRMPEMTVASRE